MNEVHAPSRHVASPVPPVGRAQAIWPVLLAVAIFFASGRSDVASPDIIGIDKISHFSVFGLLGTLVVRLLPPRRAWLALVIVSTYGLADEWRQSFTPGRMVEVADWIADTLGASSAIALYRWSPRYRAFLEAPVGRSGGLKNGR